LLYADDCISGNAVLGETASAQAVDRGERERSAIRPRRDAMSRPSIYCDVWSEEAPYKNIAPAVTDNSAAMKRIATGRSFTGTGTTTGTARCSAGPSRIY
jgi:hypothetical protein